MATTIDGTPTILALADGHIEVCGVSSMDSSYAGPEDLDLSAYLKTIVYASVEMATVDLYEARVDVGNSNYGAGATVAVVIKHAANGVDVTDTTDLSALNVSFRVVGTRVLTL